MIFSYYYIKHTSKNSKKLIIWKKTASLNMYLFKCTTYIIKRTAQKVTVIFIKKYFEKNRFVKYIIRIKYLRIQI